MKVLFSPKVDFNMFGIKEQSAIKQVKIPYRSGGGSGGTLASGNNGLLSNAFLLSCHEVGWVPSDLSGNTNYFPVDGAKLSYFEYGNGTSANQKRKSTYLWHLRSPRGDSVSRSLNVLTSGERNDDDTNVSRGVRPALVLPSTAVFDENTMLPKGVA